MAHLGNTPLLFFFLNYCIHFHFSLFFLITSFSYFICFRVFMKLVALVFQICYSCVYCCQHQFHFQTIAPLRFIVLSWSGWNCFFAYIRFSSLYTVACCSAIRFIPYLFRFGFLFTITPSTDTSIGYFKLFICTKVSLNFLLPSAAAIQSA